MGNTTHPCREQREVRWNTTLHFDDTESLVVLTAVLQFLEAKRGDVRAAVWQQPPVLRERSALWRQFASTVWGWLRTSRQLLDCECDYLWRAARAALPSDLRDAVVAFVWYHDPMNDGPPAWLSPGDATTAHVSPRTFMPPMDRPDPNRIDTSDMLTDPPHLLPPSGRIGADGLPVQRPPGDVLWNAARGVAFLLLAKRCNEWIDKPHLWNPDWFGNHSVAFRHVQLQWQTFVNVAWAQVAGSSRLDDVERRWLWSHIRPHLPCLDGRPLYPVAWVVTGQRWWTPPTWARDLEQGGRYERHATDDWDTVSRVHFVGHPGSSPAPQPPPGAAAAPAGGMAAAFSGPSRMRPATAPPTAPESAATLRNALWRYGPPP